MLNRDEVSKNTKARGFFPVRLVSAGASEGALAATNCWSRFRSKFFPQKSTCFQASRLLKRNVTETPLFQYGMTIIVQKQRKPIFASPGAFLCSPHCFQSLAGTCQSRTDICALPLSLRTGNSEHPRTPDQYPRMSRSK